MLQRAVFSTDPLSLTARANVPNEDLCGMLNLLNNGPIDATSQSAMKSTEAWISTEDNDEVLTLLQLDT